MIKTNRKSCLLLGAALALGLTASPRAQVLEIDAQGAVTVHDRPARFHAQGVTSLAPAPRASTSASPATSLPLALTRAADAVSLSPALVEAVAWRESRLRPGVISSAGAVGEMQLMPGTARELGVNPYDTNQNYFGGATYLNRMLQRYDGDIIRALAAYNAGPGAVDRYGGVPPYKETRAYVAAIMDRLSQKAEADAER